MTTKDDGGPAFPMTVQSWNSNLSAGASGMTLRDWFAGQALALLAGRSWDHVGADQALLNRWATTAYLLADAMLAARGGRDE
jgi:hypothetical protein